MAIRDCTTSEREVYATPERRVVVTRTGPKEYWLHLDGVPTCRYDYQAQAEVAGGVWLHEQAERVVVETADQPAEQATAPLAGRALDLFRAAQAVVESARLDGGRFDVNARAFMELHMAVQQMEAA